MLGLTVESALKSMERGSLGQEEMQRVLKEVLKGTYEVCNKINKVEARNELLEASMRESKKMEQNLDEESDSEDGKASCLINLGTRSAMEVFSDLIRDANKHFSKSSKYKKMGYEFSFKQF